MTTPQSLIKRYAVFPCGPDKRPLTPHGYKDASRDPAIIDQWARQYPGCIWGIPCEPNGFFAVDVDPAGLDTWKSWAKENPFNYGPCQKTPRGGYHVLFKLPGFAVPNNAGKLAPGIDLRSAGYICTGTGYTWQGGHSFDTEIQEAPAWLLDRIQSLAKPKTPQNVNMRIVNNADPHAAGRYWLEKALDQARPGNRNETGFNLALQLRDSGLTQSQARPIMQEYAARVPQGTNNPYTEFEALQSLTEAYKGTPREPATLPRKREPMPNPKPEPAQPTPEPKPEHSKPAPRKTSYTMQELYEADFPEPKYVVPKIVQEGLVMLSGRPKAGKSLLGLNIAGAVGCGGMALGEKVDQGNVLYLSLEDNPRLVRDRLQKMGIPKAANIRFEFTWQPLQKAGLNTLHAEIVRDGYSLVVIDTLSRALPGVNHTDEQPIGYIMDNLHDIATSAGMTILPIDHTRKNGGMFPDPIDDIMGSTSKSRAVDEVLALYSEPGKATKTLKGRGREIGEIDLALTFDPLTLTWQSQGSADQLHMTKTRREILAALQSTGKTQAGAIAQITGLKAQNVYEYLNNLVNAGIVRQERLDGHVYYEALEEGKNDF